MTLFKHYQCMTLFYFIIEIKCPIVTILSPGGNLAFFFFFQLASAQGQHGG